ncbi:MAG: hypothetical protein ACLQVF_17625 [Isosphaeraceae bacterium]
MAINNDNPLYAKAIAEDWPLTPEKRALVIDTLTAVMVDPNSRPREKVNAARALIASGKVNLDAVRSASLVERHAGYDGRFDAAREDAISLREHFERMHELARLEEIERNTPSTNGTG